MIRRVMPTDASTVDLVVAHSREVLGNPSDWRNPEGYPDSLALCLIDAIYSLGIGYDSHVVPVLTKYREHRRGEGADANSDTVDDLLGVFDRLGGAEAFASQIGTQHRTSTHPGAPLKAEAVEKAALLLVDHGVQTPADLLAADPDKVKQAWRLLPGQRSSTTGWRYLLLLAGADEVKPDRMILRFVADAVGETVSTSYAGALVAATATRLGVPVRVLDHAIWRWQSGRRDGDPPSRRGRRVPG